MRCRAAAQAEACQAHVRKSGHNPEVYLFCPYRIIAIRYQRPAQERMAEHSLAKGDDMRDTHRRGRFRRMLSFALSGLLALSMFPTAGLAEQIEALPDDPIASEEAPIAEAQDAGEEGPVVEAQDDDIVWKEWTSASGLPTEAGNWKLTQDVTLSREWSVPQGTTNLHLNGRTITADGGFDTIPLWGNGQRTLSLYDLESNDGKVTHAEGRVGRGVYVGPGSEFNLHGGNITGNAMNFGDGGGVAVDGGTFNMHGGKISNNNAGDVTNPSANVGCGAGVYISSRDSQSGTFNMHGGTIEHNKAAYQGGGVYCESGGRANIYYGAIQHNQALTDRGGGMYCDSSGSIQLSGGTIQYNESNNGGGGIYACDTITVSGTPIVENNTSGATSDTSNIELDDQGTGRTITITGKLAEGARMGITTKKGKPFTFTSDYADAGNSETPSTYFFSDDPTCTVLWTRDGKEARLVAASTAHAITAAPSDLGAVTTTLDGASTSQAVAGDTVTVAATPTDKERHTLDELTVTRTGDPNTTVKINSDNTFTMPDHDVTVTASFRERHFHDDIEFEPWKGTADNPLPSEPGAYYLTGDVTLTNTWDAPRGGDYPTRLCLNGHGITLNQSVEDSQPVIRVKQGENGAPCKLFLYDNDENEGTVTHANGKQGSGVQVEAGGTFVMKGGTISNNDANTYGGGVCVGSGGSATMEGGSIAQNKAATGGGGVAVEGGTFTLTDGTIQKNGGDSILYGGGVYVGDGGTFKLFGGAITNNQAARGGGIAGHAPDGPTYQIHLSGNPKVKDNRAERENYSCYGDNLCLIWPKTGNVPIAIDGPLENDDKIGIAIIQDQSMGDHQSQSFEYTDGVFTTGYRASQSTDPWQYFTSENPNRQGQVLWTPNGTEAQLAVARHITVDPGITGGTVTPSRDFAAEDETIPIQATPDEGWELVSVTAKDAAGKDVAVRDNRELVVPASDVVVSATFKKLPTPDTPALADIHVTYTAHVQKKGDLPAVSDGKEAGTTGESRRLEAMSATVDTGGIEYRAHLQSKGWSDWVSDGTQAGTTGESRRIEAIQMRLTGSPATDGYHVWYRVHSQTYGWLGWACDGEPAGTAGMSKRAEAYQVLVLQGNAKPTDYDASKPAYRAQATANARLQKSGWTGTAFAGKIGTTGQYRRMEALRLSVPHQPFAGGIAYQVHEQKKGWTAEKTDGALAGSIGESRRIEAVRIRLTGELANHLSVWYRVHSQTYGWSGWTCDGASAGTEGLSKRAEAVDIRILPKGAPAPGSTSNAFRTR